MSLRDDGERLLQRRGLSAVGTALGVLVLTAAHHGYGAVIYAATFRRHVVLAALPLAVVIAAGGAVGLRLGGRLGRAARALTIGLIIIFPIGAIGLFEGLYNHVLKDALFLAGLYDRWGPTLFPAPAYERPGDLAFEATGVLQFPLAVVAAAQLGRWGRALGEAR